MPTQIVEINGVRGEYTGYSRIKGQIIHYFSMYDGGVIRMESLGRIDVTPFEAPKMLGGVFNYGCTKP